MLGRASQVSRLLAQPQASLVTKRGFAGPPPNSFFKGTPHERPPALNPERSDLSRWLQETWRNMDAKTFAKHVVGFAGFVYLFTLPNRTPGMLGTPQQFVERPRENNA